MHKAKFLALRCWVPLAATPPVWRRISTPEANAPQQAQRVISSLQVRALAPPLYMVRRLWHPNGLPNGEVWYSKFAQRTPLGCYAL